MKDKINELSQIVDKLLIEVDSQLHRKYKDSTVDKDSEYFFFLLLTKLSDNLFTSNTLFKELKKHPQIHGGLCLILRTCLTDVITFHHLISFLENGKNESENIEFQNRVKDLWADHLNFIINFNKKKESWGYLNKENKENEVILINNRFNDYFEVPLDQSWNYKLKPRNRFNIEKIINEVLYKNDFVFKAYELYNIYSKLEHNGELTEEVHNLFYNQEPKALECIYSSFTIVSVTICNVSQFLFQEADGLNKKIESFQNEIVALSKS